MITSCEQADIYAWDWNYPMEKMRRVLLICGDGPRRIRDILESLFGIDYTRSFKHIAGRLETFQKPDGETCYVVILCEDWTNSNKGLAVLSHEINHLVFTHFKEKGYHIPLVDNSSNDEELFNTQAEYWMFTMLEALNAPADEKAKHLWIFNNETRIDHA